MTQRIYADITAFLAHSITIELAASEQLRELAEAMTSQHHQDLALLFEKLADQSDQQGRLVEQLSTRLGINNRQAWDYLLSNAKLSGDVGGTKNGQTISPLAALQTALSIEESALATYRDIADKSQINDICRYASDFAAEELMHCEVVKEKIANLNTSQPDNPVIALNSKRKS